MARRLSKAAQLALRDEQIARLEAELEGERFKELYRDTQSYWITNQRETLKIILSQVCAAIQAHIELHPEGEASLTALLLETKTRIKACTGTDFEQLKIVLSGIPKEERADLIQRVLFSLPS